MVGRIENEDKAKMLKIKVQLLHNPLFTGLQSFMSTIIMNMLPDA
jgi:hypothetical protein